MPEAVVHRGAHCSNERSCTPEHPILDGPNIRSPCPGWLVCGRVRFVDDADVQTLDDDTTLRPVG